MKVMYQRVSTIDQNLARQKQWANRYSVEKVFADKCSGKNAKRPELEKMLEFVREGDFVIVESIDRLARCVKDLLEIVGKLKAKQVQFISIKENIDTSTPTGKFCLRLFGSLAELERDTIRERQMEGIALAKERGVYKGRAPRKIDLDKFRTMCEEWINGNRTATSIQKEFAISGTTFYRWSKAYGFALPSKNKEGSN